MKYSGFAKKLLITVGIIILYRIGSYILIPGLTYGGLEDLVQSSGTYLYGPLPNGFSIFSLGIAPYFFSTAIILLLAMVVPPLKRLLYGDRNDLLKLEKIIMIVTVIWAIAQAVSLRTYIQNVAWRLVRDQSGFEPFIYVLVLVCGCLIVVFLAKTITRKGIANGVLILVFLDSLQDGSGAALNPMKFARLFHMDSEAVLFILPIIVVMVVLSIIIIQARRNIEISPEAEENHTISFPIRVNAFGVIPLVNAAAIVGIMMSSFNFFYIQPGEEFFKVWSYVITAANVLILSYIAAVIIFKPKSVLETLSYYKYSISEFSPEEDQAKKLNSIYLKIITPAVIFLLLIVLRPLLFPTVVMDYDRFFSMFFTYKVLIVSCVVIDIIKRYKDGKAIEPEDRNSLELLTSCNTELESLLISDIMKRNNIACYINKTRVFAASGTFFLWEVCTPRLPYLVYHRNLGDGNIEVLVPGESLEKASALLIDLEEENTLPE
ncbi:MAG: hypothetical protein GY754_42465 [bacterium]|nr:hypothetical protein [bacterium]